MISNACGSLPPFAGLDDFDYGLRKALDSQFDWETFGKLLIENTAEHVLYQPVVPVQSF